LGQLYEQYKNDVKEKPAEEVLDSIGVHRYCCRRMFVSHVDMVDVVLRYPRA
jgi:DNA-directed RNA polymerase subunit N